MRREDYERSYGRRGLPPPVSPSHESTRRSRKSRRKMKCLISVGLILPALAAIIGVAAWAVSADVVMNSNGNRVNKADNQLMQGISGSGRDDRRGDIFQNDQNHQNSRANDRNQILETQPTERTTRRTTTLAPTPSTADVSAILSKLISASNAASGGSGPRFVVVAPLPDHAQVVPRDDKEPVSVPTISRADHAPTAKFDESWKPTRNEDNNNHDLLASASHQRHQIVNSPSFHHGSTNLTNRVGLTNNKPINHRRAGEQQQQPSFVIDLSNNNNNKRRGFNSPIDLSGFEPFMSPETLLGSQSVAVAGPHPPQVPGYVATGPFKSKNHGSQQVFMNSQRDPPLYEQHHVFKEPASFVNKPNPSFGGFGLKPIQQQHHLHHHHDTPLIAEESNRWGAVSFHPPPLPALHIPKPPEGISLSISSPGKGHVHSAEPVSVIKSFFLPFLPKPKLNMNARVVFGVVLDKGVGLGGQKKDAGHLRPY